MDVVVQPSVPWMNLNDQIKESGLFFPVDPGPSVSERSQYFKSHSASPKGAIRIVLIIEAGQNRRYGRHELQVRRLSEITTRPVLRL